MINKDVISSHMTIVVGWLIGESVANRSKTSHNLPGCAVNTKHRQVSKTQGKACAIRSAEIRATREWDDTPFGRRPRRDQFVKGLQIRFGAAHFRARPAGESIAEGCDAAAIVRRNGQWHSELLCSPLAPWWKVSLTIDRRQRAIFCSS